MELKDFSLYLKRPIERFEDLQKDSFKKVLDVVNSNKFPEGEYEINCIGFLSPHTRWYTKYIVESKINEYSLFFLYDIPLRRTNQVCECIIPTSLATKLSIHNTPNICVRFSRFKKNYVVHKGIEDYIGKYVIVKIDDFEVINPIKLRTVTAKESFAADKLRNELLFDKLYSEEPPSNVKLAILNSLFLSPKLKSRSGIETKSLIENSSTSREIINLDRYNHLINSLILPEISNNHYPHYVGDSITYEMDSINENFQVYIKYPQINYYFNAICVPNKKEDEKANLRNLTSYEIGINHQSKFLAYYSKKDLIDKFISTEFFYKQEYLPKHKIVDIKRPLSVIQDQDNKELLYNDYVSRLYKPLPEPSYSVSEEHKVLDLAEDYTYEL